MSPVGWYVRIWKSRLSHPSTVLTLLDFIFLAMAFGAILLGNRVSADTRKKTKRWVISWLVFHALLLLAITAFRVDERLVSSLEGRIPQFTGYDGNVDGIILLGGSECIGLSKTLSEPIFNEEGQRILKVAALAHEYPSAKIILTGGVPDDNPTALSESMVSRMALQNLKVPNLEERVILEKKSHNTHENIIYAQELVEMNEESRWLLVTSATHMPRAIGSFRKLGWKGEVVPVPAGFRTAGFSPALWTGMHFEVGKAMYRFDLAVREYLALGFYYVRGYTDELFPSYVQEIRPEQTEL